MQSPETGHMEPIAEADVQRRRDEGRCVLTIGQHVELAGGHFRVAAIGKRFVRLEGVPGTRVAEGARE